MARVGKVGRWGAGATVICVTAVLGLWITGAGCWLLHHAILLTSGAWSAIAAWATFLVAAIAAGFAYFQVKVARQTREEQAQPNVVAFAESTPQHMQYLDIVIRNFGSTPAYHVTIEASPEIRRTPDDQNEGSPSVVKFSEISILAPNQEIRTLWDYAVEREEYMDALRENRDQKVIDSAKFAALELGSRHEAVVRYKDGHGKGYEVKSTLDFNILRDTQFVKTYTLHDLTKRVETQTEQIAKIASALNDFSKEHKGIWVYPSDADAERQYWIDYRTRLQEQRELRLQRIREAQVRNAARSQDESGS